MGRLITTQRALRAFFGDPADTLAGGYAHWFTQSKVTKAEVDANNATGKVVIDTALFAMGGWSGLGSFGAEDSLTGTGSAVRGNREADRSSYGVLETPARSMAPCMTAVDARKSVTVSWARGLRPMTLSAHWPRSAAKT